MRLRNLTQLGVTVLIIGEVDTALLDLLIRQRVEYALRDDRCAIVHTHNLTLQDSRDNEVYNLLHRNFGFVEHLGDNNHGVVASLTDTECEVAGRATHSSQYEPVAIRASIYIDGASDNGTLIFGRLVAERGSTLRQRKVVVDGLGNVDIGNGILLSLEELGNAVGC